MRDGKNLLRIRLAYCILYIYRYQSKRLTIVKF